MTRTLKKALLMIAMVMMIAVVVAPVSATTENINLEYTAGGGSYGTVYGGGSGTAPISTYWKPKVNFTLMRNPSAFILYYGTTDDPTIPNFDTPFIMTVSNVTIATGTMQSLNGSFYVGGGPTPYRRAFTFFFSSYDGTGQSGVKDAEFHWTNTSGFGSIATFALSGPSYSTTVPIVMMPQNQYGPIGNSYQYTLDTGTDYSTIGTIESLSPSDPFMLTKMNLNKVGTSITRVYSNNSLIYMSGTSDLPISDVNLVGSDLYVSMNVPSTGAFVNSSVIFHYTPATTPTPTPTSTITISPTSPYNNENVIEYGVFDATNPSFAVSDVTIGIKNTSSGTWLNQTAATGGGYFYGTGSTQQYLLGSNEPVVIAASKSGYDSAWEAVNVSGHKQVLLYLTPDSKAASGGAANFVVICKNNADNSPIASVTVILTTGVSGACSVEPNCRAYTDSNGVAHFNNVSASTTAMVQAISQAYGQQSKSVSVNLNATNTVTFSMVRQGYVPVTTPVATQVTKIVPGSTSSGGGTSGGGGTVGVYPTITNANGQVITSGAEKGFASFGLLIDATYVIMQIAVGLVMIWLLWETVYIITGGKIIDKIMRRGRR